MAKPEDLRGTDGAILRPVPAQRISDVPIEERLTPLRAAGLFVEFCEALKKRGEQAIEEDLNHRDGVSLVNTGDPTFTLHAIISIYYAGTESGKNDLLINGFSRYGSGIPTQLVGYDTDREYEERKDSLRYSEDRTYDEWPVDLGINLDKGNAGVFSLEGAKNHERESITLKLIGVLSRLEIGQASNEEIVDLQQHIEEFGSYFRELFFNGSDKIAAMYHEFVDRSGTRLENPTFSYERDPVKRAIIRSESGGKEARRYKVLAVSYPDLLTRYLGRYVLITEEHGNTAVQNVSFLSYPEAMEYFLEHFPSEAQVLVHRVLPHAPKPEAIIRFGIR